MEKTDKLDVLMQGHLVGNLAPCDDGRIAFEYCDEWLANGFSISPFELPLQAGIFVAEPDLFDGLFGVFYDSLPSGWGRLLTDRLLLRNNVSPANMGPLERLIIVGSSGQGALEYQPAAELDADTAFSDFDELELESERIWKSEEVQDFDRMFTLAGGCGGAQPKVFLNIEGKEWIVKFMSPHDHNDVGKMELDYACCAKACGIEMPEVRLFESEICDGYFGVERFDRKLIDGGIQKLHMVSASTLLHVSHRVQTLDYNSLMELTRELTQDYGEVEQLFRRMCFNVFAHNRDDHSNDFSFLWEDGKWRLAPAYDLTFSNPPGGEHTMKVNGNGKNPGIANIISVAEKAGLDISASMHIASQIRECVTQMLGGYLTKKI